MVGFCWKMLVGKDILKFLVCFDKWLFLIIFFYEINVCFKLFILWDNRFIKVEISIFLYRMDSLWMILYIKYYYYFFVLRLNSIRLICR